MFLEKCTQVALALALLKTYNPMRRSERPQPALGEAVRQLREKSGKTQEALSRDAGVTTATLSLIERGQANPTWDTLRKIATALGSSMGELGKRVDGLEAKK